jgi:hypothetical protein
MNGRHVSTWEPGVAGLCRALLGTDASGRGCHAGGLLQADPLTAEQMAAV